jgi:fused signal recognition particle receptor
VGFFSKLRDQLGRARSVLAPIIDFGANKRPLDDAFWAEFEETLLVSDFGVVTTEKILANLRVVATQELWKYSDQLVARFKRDVAAFMTVPEEPRARVSAPHVILVVGVNGSGKTTSIGKLAKRLRNEGKKVMVVAADTFRAAAAEQLAIWAERSGADFVRGREGADPSSVVFDGVVAGKARGMDVVIIDTAGRLQNKTNLMEELKKMRRIIERELGRPPDDTYLVLDATTGQNAISQAKLFNEATALTGLILTKLDSTAKGGVVVAVVDTVEVPIRYVGLGEKIEALEPFVPADFLDALLNN